ncbi:unnamed protein product [Acanthosepion pharaonis]|uniref:Uncharacterized protein n=1 Tax=Acanthosepion pharaonis TaxID=158019 RepID=A0A812DDU5_ACAPH|nr:unnamed protein product [Sepia pharaonis]
MARKPPSIPLAPSQTRPRRAKWDGRTNRLRADTTRNATRPPHPSRGRWLGQFLPSRTSPRISRSTIISVEPILRANRASVVRGGRGQMIGRRRAPSFGTTAGRARPRFPAADGPRCGYWFVRPGRHGHPPVRHRSPASHRAASFRQAAHHGQHVRIAGGDIGQRHEHPPITAHSA